MTRNRLVVIGALAAAGLVAGLLLVFLGGSSNPAVAHVGPDTIRRDQLDLAVEHFRQEAKAEGRPFPDEGSVRFRYTRNRLLGVLVYRTELTQAAKRLGIRVSNIEVLRRLNGGNGSEEQSADRFQYDTVKAQLLLERIYAKVTRGITASTTPELAARRNAAMKRFVDRLERETKVRYEPGYEPGP
jgi:SurA N-terminal domain